MSACCFAHGKRECADKLRTFGCICLLRSLGLPIKLGYWRSTSGLLKSVVNTLDGSISMVRYSIHWNVTRPSTLIELCDPLCLATWHRRNGWDNRMPCCLYVAYFLLQWSQCRQRKVLRRRDHLCLNYSRAIRCQSKWSILILIRCMSVICLACIQSWRRHIRMSSHCLYIMHY